MAFNPLQSYLQGHQAGQGQQIQRLSGALAGEMKQGGDIQKSQHFQDLMALDPDRANKAMATFEALDKSRKTALYEDMVMARTLLSRGDAPGALNIFKDRIDFLGAGEGSQDSQYYVDSITNAMNTGDFSKVSTDLSSGIEGAQALGLGGETLNNELKRAQIANLKAPKAVEQTPLEKAQEKVEAEFIKEERQVARTVVTNFNKRATEIRSSFGKIESVLNSGKLNRMKIASAMTSMARLLSPGVVTEQDFKNQANAADPVAQLLALLTGKGDEGAKIAENLQRFYDPANPDLFDKKAFLDTARNVSGAEIPALIDTFNDARDRAGRAGVSERALDTNFGQNKNFDFLSNMLEQNKPVMNHPTLGSVTEGQIQETMKNKGMTREQVMALLSDGNE